MNDNARLWIKALRSGEYEQTTGQLRDDKGFCCLGVACDLYAAEHPDAKWNRDVDEDDCVEHTILNEAAVLPTVVRAWLGLKGATGEFVTCATPYQSDALAARNDNGATFAQVADLIEREPEGLFA